MKPTFYEFFAGGGMAKLGLGDGWKCLFANDFDPMKAKAYIANHGGDHFHEGDVAKVKPAQLPGHADLIWGSFPCQDLSLAGKGAGLGGERSGVFWAFWDLIKQLKSEGRAPRIVALENVFGLLSARRGGDFNAICEALAKEGYAVGAMVLDAAHFLPQSRPRVFIVGYLGDPPKALTCAAPDPTIHPERLRKARNALGKTADANWVWWRMDMPAASNMALVDLIEDDPAGVTWHSPLETDRLIAMMTPLNLAKVQGAQLTRKKMVGAIYKRTRVDAGGVKHQRAEVRFDDLAGCLRTPGGGSSRQSIIVVKGNSVRSRLLSPREAARLMGLPEDYKLPAKYNDAYHLAGDGVAVDVVRHLRECLFEPLLRKRAAQRHAA